jgi:hypothetical protein
MMATPQQLLPGDVMRDGARAGVVRTVQTLHRGWSVIKLVDVDTDMPFSVNMRNTTEVEVMDA